MLVLVLRLLHLASMATWFAGMVFTPGEIRRGLDSESIDLPDLWARVGRNTRFTVGGAISTLVTGVALIFAVGGFAAVPVPVHIGLLLTVIAIGVGAGVSGRAIAQIQAGLAAGESRAQVAPLAKRVAMGHGIVHLLWLTTLALMVFRSAFA